MKTLITNGIIIDPDTRQMGVGSVLVENGTVTVRDRDSMQQERILAKELEQYVREKAR